MPRMTSSIRFQRIWNSQFIRHVVVVISGTAGAQAITVLFAPLITRIYGPEAFGVLGSFMAVVAVATPLAALAYPIAIVLPGNDRDALALARLSIGISFGVALIVGATLSFRGGWLIGFLGFEPIRDYILLVPIAMLFAAWMQIAQLWLVRKREFGVLASAAIIHSLILNILKSVIGLFQPLAAVLIVLATVGYAFYAMLLAFGARYRYQATVSKDDCVDYSTLKELAHRHRDFPLYRAPQNFINAVSQSLPVLMLAGFFGPTAAGYYTLARFVMGMPSMLVAKSFSDVFYPKITDAANAGISLTPMIVKATGVLFLIAIPPVGVVILYGPFLFSFAFGAEWTVAGEYSQWLALFFLFNFINKPSVDAVPVLGIQGGLLVYEVLSSTGKVAGLVLGFYWFRSDVAAIALFSVIGVVTYILMIVWVIRHSAQQDCRGKTS